MLLIVLAFKFSLLCSASELAASNSSAGQLSRSALQEQCAQRFQRQGCSAFFQENPELAKYSINCNDPVDPAKELLACGTGATAAVKQMGSLIVAIPGAVAKAFDDTPERIEKLKLYAECVKSTDCKRATLLAAGRTEISETVLERIQQAHHLESLVVFAENKLRDQNFLRVKQLVDEAKTKFEKEEILEREVPGYIERKNQKVTSLWETGLAAAKHLGKVDACYARDVQLEMVCHGLASIFAPGVALKAGGKLYEISKILKLKSGPAASSKLADTSKPIFESKEYSREFAKDPKAVVSATQKTPIEKQAQNLTAAGFENEGLEAALASGKPFELVPTGTAKAGPAKWIENRLERFKERGAKVAIDDTKFATPNEMALFDPEKNTVYLRSNVLSTGGFKRNQDTIAHELNHLVNSNMCAKFGSPEYCSRLITFSNFGRPVGIGPDKSHYGAGFRVDEFDARRAQAFINERARNTKKNTDKTNAIQAEAGEFKAAEHDYLSSMRIELMAKKGEEIKAKRIVNGQYEHPVITEDKRVVIIRIPVDKLPSGMGIKDYLLKTIDVRIGALVP
jgi:hypothetical protein